MRVQTFNYQTTSNLQQKNKKQNVSFQAKWENHIPEDIIKNKKAITKWILETKDDNFTKDAITPDIVKKRIGSLMKTLKNIGNFVESLPQKETEHCIVSAHLAETENKYRKPVLGWKINVNTDIDKGMEPDQENKHLLISKSHFLSDNEPQESVTEYIKKWIQKTCNKQVEKDAQYVAFDNALEESVKKQSNK